MKHQMTGNAGLFHVAWELTRRGWNVMPTVRNARGADLYAAPVDDEDAVIPIQSKALSKPDPVPLGGNLDKLRSRWWIITVGANDADPVCYIMTLDEVKALADANTNKEGRVSCWLSRKNYDKPEFREAWDRLRGVRNVYKGT